MTQRVQIWTRSGGADWRDAVTAVVLAAELDRRASLELDLRCVESSGAGDTLGRRFAAGPSPADSGMQRLFCGEGIAVAARLTDATAVDRILTGTGVGLDVWRPFDWWFGARISSDLSDLASEHLARCIADVSSIVVCDIASLEALEEIGIVGCAEVLPAPAILAGNTFLRDVALAHANQLRAEGALPAAPYVLIENDPSASLAEVTRTVPRGHAVVALPAPLGVESTFVAKLTRSGCRVIELQAAMIDAVIPAVAAARHVVASSPTLVALAASYGTVSMTSSGASGFVEGSAIALEHRIDRLGSDIAGYPQSLRRLATLRLRFGLLRQRLIDLQSSRADRVVDLETASNGQLRDLASVAQALAMKVSELQRDNDLQQSPAGENTDATIAQLRAERGALEQQLLATLGSRSWRYLAPLRKAAAAGRSMLRR